MLVVSILATLSSHGDFHCHCKYYGQYFYAALSLGYPNPLAGVSPPPSFIKCLDYAARKMLIFLIPIQLSARDEMRKHGISSQSYITAPRIPHNYSPAKSSSKSPRSPQRIKPLMAKLASLTSFENLTSKRGCSSVLLLCGLLKPTAPSSFIVCSQIGMPYGPWANLTPFFQATSLGW